MATALSSLRVTSDFDASGYVRGAAQKVAADAQMIASDKARNASLALADASMAQIVPGMASVSKALLDGYGAGSQFASVITRIGNAVDRGMGLDRANLLLDAAYQKFGLTADAAMLAEKGFVSVAGAVGELNERYEQLALASASAAAAVTRSSTQAGINQAYGINVAPAKSAQESADAFLAQYGGLDGVASQKAKEAGAAFSADLDSSLIAGTTKSARDSASVFDTELSKLDAIATLRAQQAGSNFQKSLTEALGGGGPAATSQGATYSALAEQIQQLDVIEQARASHLAASTQVGVAAAFGIDQQAKSAKDSASVFLEAAQSEDAMASKAAALRAQIDPMSAEFANLGKQMADYKALLDNGTISSEEYQQAQAILANRLGNVQQSLLTAGSAGRVMSGELVNLSYQVNDVVTGLLLGQPVFMIFAQQGGQIFQIFQNAKGSIGDFASTIGSKLLGMVTVGRLAFGGIAGSIGLATIALESYLSSQQKVQLALTGSGRASGSTVGSINSIASTASTPTGLSTSEARDLATALAATGKVANDNILPIVQMGKDIGRAFGEDAAGAAKLLANAFADPVKGADDLNVRLGFLDAATKTNISNLTAQNNLYGAQQVLLTAVKTSLSDVALTATSSQTLWTAVGNAISNAYNGLGVYLAMGLGLSETLHQKVVQAKKDLDDLKAGSAPSQVTDLSFGLGPTFTDNTAAVKAAQDAYDKLAAAELRLADASKIALEAQQSLAQQTAIRTALPAVGQTEQLQNQLTTLQNLANAPDVNDRLLKTGQTMDQLQRSIVATSAAIAAIPKQGLVDFLGAAASPAERLAAGLEAIAQKGAQINATPAQTGRATSALNLDISSSVQAARMSALGASASSVDVLKQKTLDLARAQQASAGLTPKQIQDQKDLAVAQANGSLAIKAQVDSTNIQTATIGMTVGAAAEYTARMNLMAEAARNHKVLTDSDIDSINAQAKALGAATQAAAVKQVNNDISIGQQTSLLSPDDVQIAQQLKGIYPDVATALQSVQGAALQTNQAFSGLSSTISGDLVTGLADISTSTKPIGQGFTDMSNTVIRAIEEMIIKITVVTPLMRALQSAAGSLGIPGLSAAAGSSSSALPLPGQGSFIGPVANAKGNAFSGNIIPFARGGAFTNSIVNSPTMFRFANGAALGMMGEAGPEAVMPLRRGSDGKLGVSMNGGYSGGPPANGNASPLQVNVINQTGVQAQTETSRGPNGDVTVVMKKMVDGAVGDSLTNGTGRRVLGSQYGVKQFAGR